MKTNHMVALMSSFALSSALMCGGSIALADETSSSTKDANHDEHHPAQETKKKEIKKKETKKKESAKSSKGNAEMQSGMAGSMGSGNMKDMMNNCMQMHKDSKMCSDEMMHKCEEKMDHEKCMKMMDEMKEDHTKK